jgi:hypothetical protein
MVCVRKETLDKEGAKVILGSKIDWCRKCFKAVMISPAARNIVAQRKLEIICHLCANLTPENILPPTPEQWKEIKENIGEGES